MVSRVTLISNYHIGFDPDYEVIKKTRSASNKTPDERMAYLVVVIVQEGNNKQFCVCLGGGGGRFGPDTKSGGGPDVTKPRGCREQIFQTRTQSHFFLTTHNSG